MGDWGGAEKGQSGGVVRNGIYITIASNDAGLLVSKLYIQANNRLGWTLLPKERIEKNRESRDYIPGGEDFPLVSWAPREEWVGGLRRQGGGRVGGEEGSGGEGYKEGRTPPHHPPKRKKTDHRGIFVRSQ